MLKHIYMHSQFTQYTLKMNLVSNKPSTEPRCNKPSSETYTKLLTLLRLAWYYACELVVPLTIKERVLPMALEGCDANREVKEGGT